MAEPSSLLLTSILRDVSRSFYLTLRVLPRSIRPQIGTAYLLARTSDTIADTEIVALQKRVEALIGFRDRVIGRNSAKMQLGELAGQQGTPAERVLLSRWEETISLLKGFDTEDVGLIRQVLEIIISGQLLDVERFAEASRDNIVALKTPEELDDYTYRVAGCVGEFWTHICRRHLFPNHPLEMPALLMQSVQFGKGLQLVNVLRDVPRDLRQGRCYIPTQRLARSGLQPTDLLNEDNERTFRKTYDPYLDEAKAHLQAGWQYTCTIPYRCVRVRLACAWPLLIGFETVRLLSKQHVLNSEQRVKVSRPRVKRLIMNSLIYYPFPRLWNDLPT